MYNEKVLNIFAELNNVGIIQNASGIGQYTNKTTNEITKLYIKIDDNYITNATFKTFSGVLGIAIMSVYTEMLKNKSINEALSINENDLSYVELPIHCFLQGV